MFSVRIVLDLSRSISSLSPSVPRFPQHPPSLHGFSAAPWAHVFSQGGCRYPMRSMFLGAPSIWISTHDHGYNNPRDLSLDQVQTKLRARLNQVSKQNFKTVLAAEANAWWDNDFWIDPTCVNPEIIIQSCINPLKFQIFYYHSLVYPIFIACFFLFWIYFQLTNLLYEIILSLCNFY